MIVGCQSSGKSSLLQTLTDIPFPVGIGTCTLFPIRVVSRRTPPGSNEGYRITVEEPEHKVEGLGLADREALGFAEQGESLSAEEFRQVMGKVRSGTPMRSTEFKANI